MVHLVLVFRFRRTAGATLRWLCLGDIERCNVPANFFAIRAFISERSVLPSHSCAMDDALEGFPSDLIRRDSQGVRGERFFRH
jgi:hypothetical protein